MPLADLLTAPMALMCQLIKFATAKAQIEAGEEADSMSHLHINIYIYVDICMYNYMRSQSPASLITVKLILIALFDDHKSKAHRTAKRHVGRI